MVDPTSELGEVDPTDAPECFVCGERIVGAGTQQVVTWVEDDEIITRRFCTDSCREAWDDERPGG
jgi:hypothetical protein